MAALAVAGPTASGQPVFADRVFLPKGAFDKVMTGTCFLGSWYQLQLSRI